MRQKYSTTANFPSRTDSPNEGVFLTFFNQSVQYASPSSFVYIEGIGTFAYALARSTVARKIAAVPRTNGQTPPSIIQTRAHRNNNTHPKRNRFSRRFFAYNSFILQSP